MSKIKLSFRTSAHAKEAALLCLDFGVSFKTVQLWITEMVQKKAGPGIPGVHVQARPEQDSATGPKIKQRQPLRVKIFHCQVTGKQHQSWKSPFLTSLSPSLDDTSGPWAKNPGFVLIIPASSWYGHSAGVGTRWVQSLNCSPKDLLEHMISSHDTWTQDELALSTVRFWRNLTAPPSGSSLY